ELRIPGLHVRSVQELLEDALGADVQPARDGTEDAEPRLRLVVAIARSRDRHLKALLLAADAQVAAVLAPVEREAELVRDARPRTVTPAAVPHDRHAEEDRKREHEDDHVVRSGRRG